MRSMMSAEDVSATAKKKTILQRVIRRLDEIVVGDLRQDDPGGYEIRERGFVGAVDRLLEGDGNLGQVWVLLAGPEKVLGEVLVRQLQVPLENDPDLLICKRAMSEPPQECRVVLLDMSSQTLTSLWSRVSGSASFPSAILATRASVKFSVK